MHDADNLSERVYVSAGSENFTRREVLPWDVPKVGVHCGCTLQSLRPQAGRNTAASENYLTIAGPIDFKAEEKAKLIQLEQDANCPPPLLESSRR